MEKVLQFALLLMDLETGDVAKDRSLAKQLTLDSEGAKFVGEKDALIHKYDSWMMFMNDFRFNLDERCKGAHGVLFYSSSMTEYSINLIQIINCIIIRHRDARLSGRPVHQGQEFAPNELAHFRPVLRRREAL